MKRVLSSFRLTFVFSLLLALVTFSAALAAGTPAWWNNPGSAYSTWTSVFDTGTVSNAQSSTQFLSVLLDIPINCTGANNKVSLWGQIEYTIASGTGALDNTITGRPIAWTVGACPANSTIPYSSSDAAFMADRNAFTPTHGYTTGRERSYAIDSSATGEWPAQCARPTTTFQVDPASQINYRIEYQAVCMTPTAISLARLGAVAGGKYSFAGVIVALVLLPFWAVVFVYNKRSRKPAEDTK